MSSWVIEEVDDPKSRNLPLTRLAAEHVIKKSTTLPDSTWPIEHYALVRYFLRDPEGKSISVAELVRRSGLLRITVKNFLHGRSQPYFSTGMRIADALGISPHKAYDFAKRIRKVRTLRGTMPPRVKKPYTTKRHPSRVSALARALQQPETPAPTE